MKISRDSRFAMVNHAPDVRPLHAIAPLDITIVP